MKKRLILPLLSLTLFSCDSGKEESKDDKEVAGLDGKKLMEKDCYSCHNTQGTDNMLAPPMSRVRDHYWDDDISKEDFVAAIADWCENPTEEKSLMPGARRKFGLMPKQPFEREEVEAIAAYLYDEENEASSCSH